MAAITASYSALRPASVRVSAPRPARSTSRVVLAAAKTQEQKPSRVAQAAVAGIAALMLAAGPAISADKETLRKSICAAQPTAKICLLGSVKK
ncbi:g1495 [Coccomyxa viridis]|uniref:G1495 protein n=1 Tax=Coccomyxa viridis TaxID=1274662 RepID=A0ABP1FI48_9CHLO